MKRFTALFITTLLLAFCAFSAYAQEAQPPVRKAPRLTMDNYENGRVAAPSNKNSNITPLKSEAADSAGFVSVNPRTILEKAFAKLDKVKSMRTRLTVSTPGEARETIIEVVRPNRVRMRSAGMEMISIGSTAYYRVSEGPWQKSANPKMAESFSQSEMIKLLVDMPGVTIAGWAIGEEVIDGVSTTVYDLTISEERQSQSDTIKLRLWVGKDDLPRKLDYDIAKAGIQMSVTYEEFDKNIVINAPQM
jgi:hypothetical protein